LKKYFLILSLLLGSLPLFAQGGKVHFCLRSEPKTFDPQKVDDDASLAVRFLTGGVLARVDRKTQLAAPELAESWKISKDSREITLKLRSGIRFSDGTPFSAEDVAYTFQRLMDPQLHSSTGDAFRSGPGPVTTRIVSPTQISVTFPAPVIGLDRLLDQVAIMSKDSPKKEMAVLGPFMVAEYKAGASLHLARNPNYWKRDAQGHALPYLDGIMLDIQGNRDVELLRFQRGELDLINTLDSEYYEKLASTSPGMVHDAGPSLDSEQMWFNQVQKSSIPDYKKAWFRSTAFRQAISEAINRDDLCRIVFRGHARPAIGVLSPANHFWFNSKLKPVAYSPENALKRLTSAGFRLDQDVLHDAQGHAVEFSVITNSGNKARERMIVLMQQDLQKIGIKVSVVTLDFPALIERISQTFNYEAVLLGLSNTDLDPNGQMNVWLSSAEDHQWNPQQKTPETPWEAEIDQLMHAQASTTDAAKRKKSFDRVQEIVLEQNPFIYLITKNALSAVSLRVRGADPVAVAPQTYWNIERWTLQK
jgi:peptide/nickel transport system substrate-binding protein